MAAFAAATQLKLGSSFATGTALRSPLGIGSSSSASFAPPPQRLQVTASKKLMGKVITDTNDKSVTVEVTRIAVLFPKYKKRVRTTKNYIVHDPENAAKKGDTVVLAKCNPVSKRKHFAVVSIRSGGKQEKGRELTEEPALPPLESAAAPA